MNPHQYHVEIHWNSDRKGIMCSPELNSSMSDKGCIEVATPPQFPKGVHGIWSPEHLFTASVASCFMTTFLAIAENSKLDFKTFDCKATGILEQVNGQFLMTAVELEPTVGLYYEVNTDRASSVLQKAEKELPNLQFHNFKGDNETIHSDCSGTRALTARLA